VLKDPEFQGVLVHKMWIDVDVQASLCTVMANEFKEFVRLIDQEVEGTI
jgi:hypothetical protein